MLYAEQLRFKQSGLLALLEKQGVEPARVEAPVHGPITGYRHKARLGVRCIGDEVLVGFRESFSSRVRRMDECLNLAPRLSALMVPLKAAISRLSIRERVPQIEVASGDEGVAVVVRHLEPLVGSDADVLIDMAETTDVRLYSQPGGYDSVRRLYPQSGSDLLSYSLEAFGLNLLFHPMEFTQVNPYVNRLLVQAALVNAGGLSGKRLIDLFCGIGNFSLAFARYGAQVRGYEGDISLTRRAKENAHRNGVSAQCEFYAKDLYDRDASEVGDADILVLDPPRSGAGDNLRTWAAGDVETVVYVSCKPETFATDARILHERGYRLERVGIYDMFPQTSHVETLGVFRRQ
jgi:23S rRNA (uracil1939-C5)-methyltransferase